MSSPSSALLPIQFLNAGNLVTAGLQLYRHHFKSYFRLALLAGAWLYLPIVLLVVAVFVSILSSGEFNGASAALIGLMFLVGMPIWLSVCIAKYQAFSAAIARLAFHQLTNSPETASQASRYTNSRMWGFWLIGFFSALIFGAVAFGLYILLVIAAIAFAVVIGGTAGVGQGGTDPSNPAFVGSFMAVIGVGFLVIGIPALMFILWLFARLLVAELPYAIDRETTPTGSLGRSWDLTDKSGWRIITALVILAVVLFPIQLFQQTIGVLLQSVAVIADADQTSGIFVTAVIIGYAISLLVSLLVLPLWQATKAVLYYDLRSRREGMGLELDPQDLGSQDLGSQDLDLQDLQSSDLQPKNLQLQSNTLQVPPVMQLFRQVKLLTPESVELEFTLAGIGNRALALLIDYGILLIGGLIFWIIFGIFSYQLLQYLESSNVDYSDIPIWLLAIGFLLSFIFTTGYFAGFEVLRQGQTPGKRWAKIRVIRDDGRPVGLAQAVLRSLVQPIDYFLFIGAFLIFLGKREKRIGDWAGGTLVIQENRALKQAIELSDAAKRLTPDLPQTTDLTQLQPRHFAVIAEYLQRRPFLETKSKTDLSLDLARQTRTLISLETIPPGLTSDQFLEAVYLAYQKQFAS